jgi:hypothetical protein
MTDLTEKNLENVLLNLTKTDKPIAIKPTTWFGNPAKIAQWYTCPNCAKQSPLTLEWIGLTDEEIKEGESKEELGHGFIQGALWAEAKLKEKNG